MKRSLILIVYFLIIYNGTAIGNNDSLGIKSIDYCKKFYSTFKSEDNPDSVLHYANIIIAQYDVQNDTIKKLEYYEQTCNYLIAGSQYRLVSNLLKRFVSNAEESGKEYFIASAYFQIGRFLSLAKISSVSVPSIPQRLKVSPLKYCSISEKLVAVIIACLYIIYVRLISSITP